MVIPQWSEAKPDQPITIPVKRENLKALARPADRLAAVIIDIFVILMPAYILLSAPLKLQLTTSLLLGSDVGIAVYIALNFLVAFTLITVYQAYMHSRYGATVGKMIFNLRVKTIWTESNPKFLNSVKRSIVWQLEFLSLTIPMLGIFTDDQRRILHDRICDTEVISLKDRGIRPPRKFERRLVYSFFVFIAAIFMVSLLMSMLQGVKHLGQDRSIASLLSKSDKNCEDVTRALDAMTDEQELANSSRMQLAMSLYAAGLVEKSCLAGETEQEIDVKFNSTPLAYLAKAFVHSDDKDVSDAYLEQVCKEGPGTPECSMSELVTRWSEEDWRGVESVINNAPSGSLYLEIWAVRHYMKQGNFAKALEYVNRISPNRTVATFLQSQRVKALWGLRKESEAQVAAIQAMETMPASDQMSLSSWVCMEQLSQSCHPEATHACEWVKKHSPKDRLEITEPTIGLAELRVQECDHKADVNYTGLADNLDDDSWKIFLRASAKDAKSDKDSASSLYSQVVKYSEAADELRLEALRRFVKISKSDDIVDMVAAWREMKTGELWRESGNLLLTSLVTRDETIAAMKVAHALMDQNALSDENMQTLAGGAKEDPGNLRRPASVDKETEE